MKHHDESQWSLFLDEPVSDPSRAPVAAPDFAALRELMEFHGGEAVIEADRLGSWAGFTRERNASRFVRRRLAEFEALRLLQVGATSHAGAGAREVTRLLLNHECVNHFLIHCGLPHLRGFRLQVTRVFTEYQKHNLVSTNAETTEKLQDAAIQAEEDKLGISLLFEFGEKLKATHNAAERTARALEASIANQRRYPDAQTVRDARCVNKTNYRDHCPCCLEQRAWLGPDGGVWAHMKGRYRCTLRDGWFICPKCNTDYENSINTEKIYIKFISYLGHVEAYLAQGKIDFEAQR